MISHVIWSWRPPNDKLVMCGPVFVDVQWSADDDVMYSARKQRKETGDVILLAETMRMFRCHVDHIGAHLR